MSMTPVDYDALAQQHGGTAVVDYDALAAQHGGMAVSHDQTLARTPANYANQIGSNVVAGVGDVLGGIKNTVLHPIDTVKALIDQTKQFANTPEDEASWQGNLLKSAENAPLIGGLVRQAEKGETQVGSPESIGAATRAVTQLGAAEATAGAAGKVADVVRHPVTALADATQAVLPKLKPNGLGDMVTAPRGTVPAEAATPVELKAYADANNIPLNAAQATQHNFPLNLQSAGERASIAGTAVKAQTKAAQAAVVEHAQKLAQQFSPNTPDLETAGATLKTNVQSALEDHLDQVNKSYANVDKVAAGTHVDMRPVIDEMMNVGAEHGFVNSVASQLGPKRALGIIDNLSKNLPDNATFTQAQQLRSALLDESRHPETVMSTEAQGIIKHLTGMLDGQMEAAAKSSQNPSLLPMFRDANDLYRSMQEDFNSPRSPLRQVLDEPDPSKIPQKFTQQGQTGGSPYRIDLLDKYGIDSGPVKYALAGDLIKKDFGLYQGGKQLGGYSDAFLQKLFEPQELDSLYKTGAIARSVKLNTNPSGTAVVQGAMQDVQSPVRSLLPKAAAAKLTNSEAFNNWLMQNLQPPRTAPPATMVRWFNARQAQMRTLGLIGANAGVSDAGN